MSTVDLEELGYEDVRWIRLAQNRVQWRAPVKAVMIFRVPKKARNFSTIRPNVSFPIRTLLRGVTRLSSTIAILW